MTKLGINPFDDASGQQFLSWLSQQGGAPSYVQSLATAGTSITDATPALPGSIFVTAADGIGGIRLSNATLIGQPILVFTDSSVMGAANIYPPDTTQNFIGRNPGEIFDVSTTAIFMKISSTLWGVI